MSAALDEDARVSGEEQHELCAKQIVERFRNRGALAMEPDESVRLVEQVLETSNSHEQLCLLTHRLEVCTITRCMKDVEARTGNPCVSAFYALVQVGSDRYCSSRDTETLEEALAYDSALQPRASRGQGVIDIVHRLTDQLAGIHAPTTPEFLADVSRFEAISLACAAVSKAQHITESARAVLADKNSALLKRHNEFILVKDRDDEKITKKRAEVNDRLQWFSARVRTPEDYAMHRQMEAEIKLIEDANKAIGDEIYTGRVKTRAEIAQLGKIDATRLFGEALANTSFADALLKLALPDCPSHLVCESAQRIATMAVPRLSMARVVTGVPAPNIFVGSGVVATTAALMNAFRKLKPPLPPSTVDLCQSIKKIGGLTYDHRRHLDNKPQKSEMLAHTHEVFHNNHAREPQPETVHGHPVQGVLQETERFFKTSGRAAIILERAFTGREQRPTSEITFKVAHMLNIAGDMKNACREMSTLLDASATRIRNGPNGETRDVMLRVARLRKGALFLEKVSNGGYRSYLQELNCFSCGGMYVAGQLASASTAVQGQEVGTEVDADAPPAPTLDESITQHLDQQIRRNHINCPKCEVAITSQEAREDFTNQGGKGRKRNVSEIEACPLFAHGMSKAKLAELLDAPGPWASLGSQTKRKKVDEYMANKHNVGPLGKPGGTMPHTVPLYSYTDDVYTPVDVHGNSCTGKKSRHTDFYQGFGCAP